MPLETRRIALQRLLTKRARQRAASIARAKETSLTTRRPAGTPCVAVPAAFRKYDNAGVRELIAVGKERGYVTYDEVNRILPESHVSAEELESVIEAIYQLGFELTES
jgi:Sigma-70 factor, region 1.1